MMFPFSVSKHSRHRLSPLLSPRHPQEAERLGSVCALRFDEKGSDPLFDRIAQRTAVLVGTPMAFFNVIRGDDQISVGQAGARGARLDRDQSFCTHTIVNGGPLVVEDARRDPRFARLDAVRDLGGIRFYAGVPVFDSTELPLGSLCAVDVKPRKIAPECLGSLERLATYAGAALEARRVLIATLGSGATPLALASAQDDLARALEPMLDALASM